MLSPAASAAESRGLQRSEIRLRQSSGQCWKGGTLLGEQQPPLHQKRFSCVLGAGLQLWEGLALSFPSMWWFGSPKCQSRSCPLLEFSSGVIHPQQRPCVRSEITCQARESLRNTFSLWFSCAAPSQLMQVQRERTNRVQKIVLLFGSLLLGFLGSGFVCSLFPERRAQFLSALQYRRDAFVHLIVFGAAEKQVFLKWIFVDSLFTPVWIHPGPGQPSVHPVAPTWVVLIGCSDPSPELLGAPRQILTPQPRERLPTLSWSAGL